jgi:ATP adenylyltransferase
LLNKFPVYENHVLIVTAQFEEQQAPLSIRDFEALCICLRNVDGLAFYNAGPAAGASQTHRHLQLVPLSGQQIPMEAAFTRAVESGARHAALPFRHRLARLNFEQGAAEAHQALSVYLDLLSETGLIADPAELPERTPPYNLLCTRRWMMVCPRSREVSGSISINALGFAGTLLVSDPAELAEVKARGPMALLKEVAVESS